MTGGRATETPLSPGLSPANIVPSASMQNDDVRIGHGAMANADAMRRIEHIQCERPPACASP